jgi:hypothetical protein
MKGMSRVSEPTVSLPPSDNTGIRDERQQEREWEADEQDRAALMEAWKAFWERHHGASHKWSHELLEDERGER